MTKCALRRERVCNISTESFTKQCVLLCSPKQLFWEKGYPWLERLWGSLGGQPVEQSSDHWSKLGKRVGIPENYNGNWYMGGTQISLNEDINKILITTQRFYISFFSFLFVFPFCLFYFFFLFLDLKIF